MLSSQLYCKPCTGENYPDNNFKRVNKLCLHGLQCVTASVTPMHMDAGSHSIPRLLHNV